MKTLLHLGCLALCLTLCPPKVAAAPVEPAITFNQNFEGGSLGKIEKLADTRFRCWVPGQYDEHARNRQANWYYFRMDHVRGREIILTLTDFVGEYNDQPGACPMNGDLRPVLSEDGEHWQHFSTMAWDDTKKEATLTFRPEGDTIWIAHLPPYTHSRLLRFLDELNRQTSTRVEVIGKTSQGRDLHLITVTNFETPDDTKKTVWLQARQHAWETGTSFVMEGALRFVTSDDPKARTLRDQVVFKFTSMMDPDGCASGKVRFNANGYDVNRHWDVVDLRNKELLAQMPEIWNVKKAILGYAESGHSIDLMLNLHNDETPEYLGTMVDDALVLKRLRRFEENLTTKTTYAPTKTLDTTGKPADTFNYLWNERRVPAMLMEQQIGPNKKFGHRPTTEDRLQFGRELISVMAETALE